MWLNPGTWNETCSYCYQTKRDMELVTIRTRINDLLDQRLRFESRSETIIFPNWLLNAISIFQIKMKQPFTKWRHLPISSKEVRIVFTIFFVTLLLQSTNGKFFSLPRYLPIWTQLAVWANWGIFVDKLSFKSCPNIWWLYKYFQTSLIK